MSQDHAPQKFHKGQRVFAKDGSSGLMYEAVIRRCMFGTSQHSEDVEEWHCFVHYLGWNVSWDRWVSSSQIFEVTEKNKELATKLQQAVKDAKKKHGRKSVYVMTELEQTMKRLEQERRLEERREELAKQGIVMQEQDNDGEKRAEKTTKFTKAYFEKELSLRDQALTGKRQQSLAEKLVLPFSLKKVLVEEWEIISQCGMIPNLPVDSAITVRQVLDDYLATKITKPTTSVDSTNDDETTGETNVSEPTAAAHTSADDSTSKTTSTDDEQAKKHDQEWQEMVDGIALLFDQAVGSHLLYRQEMPQHEWIQQHDDYGERRYCQVYGCEHLLRLFIRLPALLADQLSDAEARPIFSKLGDFVRFLQKHHSKIFLQSHHTPVEEDRSRKRASDGTTKQGSKRSKRSVLLKQEGSQERATNDQSNPSLPSGDDKEATDTCKALTAQAPCVVNKR